MYRVNYGNGYVSPGTYSSRQLALAHIASQDQYRDLMFVQRRDGGEWMFSTTWQPS